MRATGIAYGREQAQHPLSVVLGGDESTPDRRYWPGARKEQDSVAVFSCSHARAAGWILREGKMFDERVCGGDPGGRAVLVRCHSFYERGGVALKEAQAATEPTISPTQ